jgi:protein-tyrosine phosphatase
VTTRVNSLLFVCMGNICRSPIAEGILRRRLAQRGLEDRLMVDSAGTGGWHAGAAPDPRAILACAEHGIDISGQRARKLGSGDYSRFNLILCADRDTLFSARSRQPADTSAELELLLAWAGQGAGVGPAAGDVPDPYGGGIDDFRHVYGLLDGAMHGLLSRLQLPA